MTATDTRHTHPFIAELQELVETEDRGQLAALRRGLGRRPGEAPEMHPFVLRGVRHDAPRRQLELRYLIASLFALHPPAKREEAATPPAHNVGASLREIRPVSENETRRGVNKAVERRFVALLNSHRDDLHIHLRHAIALLKNHDIPVDYSRLYRDIRWWDSEERRVQREWASGFWTSDASTHR